MIRYIVVLAVLAFPALAHDQTYSGTIRSIYDGDTPRADIELGFGFILENEAIRLVCVNTPELRGDEREAGLRVRDDVRALLPTGTRFTIQTHSANERGKYGRVLGVLWPDGWDMSLNRWLLDTGRAGVAAYTNADKRFCSAMK